MHITFIVLQAILGLMFLMAGLMKLGAKQRVEMFQHYGYPQWFRVVTGIVEIVGGAGMIIGIWSPVLAPLAGLWLGITMIGAIFTHIRVKDSAKATLPALVLLILSLLVVIFQWQALVA